MDRQKVANEETKTAGGAGCQISEDDDPCWSRTNHVQLLRSRKRCEIYRGGIEAIEKEERARRKDQREARHVEGIPVKEVDALSDAQG